MLMLCRKIAPPPAKFTYAFTNVVLKNISSHQLSRQGKEG